MACDQKAHTVNHNQEETQRIKSQDSRLKTQEDSSHESSVKKSQESRLKSQESRLKSQEAQTPAAPPSANVTEKKKRGRPQRPQIPPIAASLTKDIEEQRARALAAYNAALLRQ